MGFELPGYRISTQIGAGAASRIYVALEAKSGRMMAIKHVVRNSADDDRFIAQAENEFNIAGKLDHPHLRKCHAIYRTKKLLTLREVVVVMEYVDGLNLEKARPNRLNTFLTLFQRVAQGLLAMHEAGFLHTDVKPINIMLARGGVVKIIDFGQSCPMNHRKERIQGTPDYIAPEQVNRLPLDARTDIFNLGATMYWVLTSENYPTAIRGAESVGKHKVIQSHKPVAPIEMNDKIPLALSQLVMECCRKSPTDRPSDMKQVIARLDVVRDLWTRHRESMRSKLGGQTEPGDFLSDSGDSVENESAPRLLNE